MSRTSTFVFAALVASCLSSGAFADASSAQYRGCDGYGAASREGDGMTEYASILFIFNPPGYGNTDRSETGQGASGIADCDAALADLPSVHWMRKVSLLRARAMHRLETGDTAGALTDLDLADAAANNSTDPNYLRSLGWGLKVARAYALRKSGDQTQANAIAMAALAERPYNRQTVYSVMTAMGPGANDADVQVVKQDIARLVPTQVDDIFLHALQLGDFAGVIALYPHLVPPEEIGDVNLYSGDALGREWRNFRYAEMFWAGRSGVYAYALAATGRAAEARAALEAARTRLANDTQPPPPLTAKEAKDSDDVARHQGTVDIRARAAQEDAKILDSWSAEVELRIALAEGRIADVENGLKTVQLTRTWASVELLDALQAKLPKRPATRLSDALRAELAKARPYVPDVTPERFLKSLPEAETKHRLPDYSEASRPWFGGTDDSVSGEGFRVGKTNAQGVTTIRFNGGAGAPGSAVEEAALLRAADFALQSGKQGFVVVDREDIKTTITTTYYGTPLRTDPGGFETALKVVLVDPADLQEPYKSAPWRVFDAEAVRAALAPVYIKQRSSTGSPR